MATTEEIKKTAILVRDATQIGENTAERVGGVLVDLANKSKELEDNIGKKADKETVNAALDKKADKEEVNSSLKELQNTVFPLEVSLSLDKPLLEYTGSEQSIKATYSIKRKGSPITPTALALSVDGSLVSIDVKQADTVTVKVNKEGETQIILTAKHGDLVKSASSKVTMVLPIYYGFGTTETDIAIAANKLSPRLSASGTYAKTSAKDDVNFIILAPKTLPKLNNFSMGGAPFVMETSSVTINGKDYYMYKSGAIYMNGTTLNVQAN